MKQSDSMDAMVVIVAAQHHPRHGNDESSTSGLSGIRLRIAIELDSGKGEYPADRPPANAGLEEQPGGLDEMLERLFGRGAVIAECELVATRDVAAPLLESPAAQPHGLDVNARTSQAALHGTPR